MYKFNNIYKSFSLLLIVIILISLLYIINSTTKEGFDKVSLHSWWGNGDEVSTEIFEKLFQDTSKKVEVYSVMGDPPSEKKKDTIYVQFSGESRFHDPDIFDINFIPSDKKADNIILFPLGFFTILHANNPNNVNVLSTTRTLNNHKSQFCIFAVSNGSGEHRNNFFNNLSKYKKVDSCGKHLNNMESCPGTSDEYLAFLSKYKFMICFENSSVPNYFTEKLINAYIANTIPIYWGCPNISDYVNMDSILYLKHDYTDNDVKSLIDNIEYLDNNDDAYRAKFESIFFKNGRLPDECNIDKIRSNINNKLLTI